MKDLVFEVATGPTVGSASSTPSPYLNRNPWLGAGQSRNQTRILSSPQRSPAVFLRATQYWWLCLVCTCPNSTWLMTMVNLEYHFLSTIQQNKLLWWTNNSRKFDLKGKRSIYESLSDVGEIRVWFASKNLTPCRMHWNAFLIAQIIAKCHSFPNMYGML